jgi:hypothetical protein
MHARPAAWRQMFLLKFVTALLVVAPTPAALAQDAGYLGKLPTAAQVLARFGDGRDRVQTLGRQCAALSILERRFFRSHAVMTGAVESHPATRKVRQDYGQAFAALREQYAAAVGGVDDAKQRTWNAMCENRSPGGLATPVPLEAVLALLPPDVVAGYRAAYARSDALVAANKVRVEAAGKGALQRARQEELARARQAAEKREFRGIASAVLAGGLIVFAVSGRAMYRIGRYQFENRTDGGVVQYRSYGAAMRQSLVGQLSAIGFLIGGLTTFGGIAALVSTL